MPKLTMRPRRDAYAIEARYFTALPADEYCEAVPPRIEIEWSGEFLMDLTLSIGEARTIVGELTRALAEHDRTRTTRQE
ncbi:hypothetical protein [Nocardia huaxiensis]|uniref:Uncharacterized protein n=1 Tax=Nocardia huaxiensis TaxID=2755382 RepID=A0A7D6ZU76_9NOCA|nr:hypothetical protein [Nocardia huaxiensis]QLY34005.1 hypothetical protein H0264_18775 [Nocardia huaxiensis]UFS99092.1 hypothetical protein LPY97_14935 [Nocardia huaxiensis]